MFKCPAAQVDQHPVECFALAFMDRDGPGEFKRILRKRSGYFGFDAAGDRSAVADDFPFNFGDVYFSFFTAVFFCFHHNAVLVELDNFTDRAIDKLPFLLVVAHKHYLRSQAQAQRRICRVQTRIELAFHRG